MFFGIWTRVRKERQLRNGMGTFGGYTGSMHIPEEKKDEFAGQAAKIFMLWVIRRIMTG